MQTTPFTLLALSYENLTLTQGRSSKPASEDIIILAITEDTLTDLPYRSPIDRRFLATLIKKLHHSGAKAIGIDIFFDQSTEPLKDTALRNAFESISDKLVVASTVPADGISENQFAYQGQFLAGIKKATVLLAKSDLDGVVRHVHTGNALNGVYTQNLAGAMTSSVSDANSNKLERIFFQSDAQGKPHRYTTYPAESAGLLPDEWFENKYVLIGTDLPGIDQFRTPYVTRFGEVIGTMPGVMIHANSLNQRLLNLTVNEVSYAIVILVSLAASALGALLMLMNTSIILKLLSATLAATTILAIPYLSFPETHVVVPAVLIATSLLLSVFFGALAQWQENRKHQAFIKDAWARYVSPAIVEELLVNPEKLESGGENKNISIIFTDIANFTSLAERLPIERLTPIINRYFDLMSTEFLDSGATLDKFVGDGVIGFFGAPIDDPDHANKAVSLALRLNRICRQFQQTMLLEGITIGRTRIGVHSGQAIVGNLGGSRFFDYTAIGNTVNTAARLESANKIIGSSICVSGETARLATCHSFRPIGHLQLVGKQKTVDAWEPMSEDHADCVPPAEYELAYKNLKKESEESIHVFGELNERFPNDKLISFHLDRLNSNYRGVILETTK